MRLTNKKKGPNLFLEVELYVRLLNLLYLFYQYAVMYNTVILYIFIVTFITDTIQPTMQYPLNHLYKITAELPNFIQIFHIPIVQLIR